MIGEEVVYSMMVRDDDVVVYFLVQKTIGQVKISCTFSEVFSY
jgi:hypothetical protein